MAANPGQSHQAMKSHAPRTRQIVAAVIGNALEWYDFVVFGFVSVVISRLFFPASSEYARLLLTFATFGVGFFMRPVGAIALGLYADRVGRKAAMQLVIFLMTIAVAIVAFAPTYDSIGLGAPLLIVLARLLQGFATGGEFSSATSFLVEIAPAGRRGYFGSLQMVGQGLSAFLGALAGALVTRGLSPDQLDAWGWRIPFLAGLLIGPVGLYIRRHLAETDEFLAVLKDAAAPVRIGVLLRQRDGNRIQLRRDAVRRLRSFHRHLADPGNGVTDCARLLHHVRRRVRVRLCVADARGIPGRGTGTDYRLETDLRFGARVIAAA
jgi:MFS family permease